MRASARSILGCALLCATLALPGADRAAAQIPDEFTNLQVLPKDIGKGELIGIMRDFAGALGQRCNFCHVGEDPNSLEGYDFASDDLEHKRVARVMMQMVNEINGTLLPKIGHEPEHKVSCITCHRGIKEPETLQDVLHEAIEEGGVAAAAERYRALREEYYGKGAYDFSGRSLTPIAEDFARKGDLDGAVAVLKITTEANPDEAFGHLMLGQVYAQKGDTEAAIASVQRALQAEPDNNWAKQMLERLKSN